MLYEEADSQLYWGLRLAVGDYDTCHIKTLTGSQ